MSKLGLKHFNISLVIILFSFLFSVLNTYSYIDFSKNASMGAGYVYVAKSLALDKNFEISEYWGNAGVDVIFKQNGEKYIAYTPLPSVIMGFTYYLLQIIYYFYTNYIGPVNGDLSIVLESLFFGISSSISLALIGYFVYKILKHLKIDTFTINISLFSLLFGTIILNYSVSFLNHVYSTLFILLTFYFLFFVKNLSQQFKFLLAGVFTGLAFLSEHTTILVSVSVMLLLILDLAKNKNILEVVKKGLFYAIPVLISIFLMGLYNYNLWGSPFIFSEKMMFLQNQQRGIATVSFDQNIFYGLFGFYLSPSKGLFLISPALLFSFFGLKKFYKQKPKQFVFIISYVVIMSILYAAWGDCFGATPFGPRYLSSLVPFFIILSAVAINKNPIYQKIYLVLAIYGAFICVLNVFDGLPSGRWFLSRCTKESLLQYASFSKAYGYLTSGNLPASVVIRYLAGKS